MDKTKLREEIKDLSYRMEFHSEQADFHREVAEKTLKTLKRHQGQLVDMQVAESEKPRLVDLDFGIDQAKQRWIRVDGKIRWIYTNHLGTSSISDSTFNFTEKYNLRDHFDDLAALAETLEEFEVMDELSEQSIDFLINPDGQLKMRTNDSRRSYRIKNIDELILNLRRMKATMERKNG